jgi:4-amino-4-deoxy-L-arabinose transferase-like glycosyltransferase
MTTVSGAASRLTPGRLTVAGALLLVCVLFTWQTPGNPPGFHRDEASIAVNATELSRSGRDDQGALLPLYFVSFRDYKSPVFVYTLAGVFRVTGPSRDVARYLAAFFVTAAVLLVGLIAWRRTRSRPTMIATVLLAASTPWLYELARYAVEATTVPLFVCLLLLALDRVVSRDAWNATGAVLVALCLAGLTYAYAGGRVLGPLFALALVVTAGRRHVKWLLSTWSLYAIGLLPLAAYAARHPGALTARYDATSIAHGGTKGLPIVWEAVRNYAQDVVPWRWATGGDVKPLIHASDYPALTLPVLALALSGSILILLRRRGDRWWRTVLLLTALAPIPGALTVDRMHQLRMVAVPVLLCVLAIPALQALGAAVRTWNGMAIAIAVALATILAFQTVHWQRRYRESGPGRIELFEAGIPALVDQALTMGVPVYVDFDDLQAQAQLRWRAIERGLADSSTVVLPDGGAAPSGATVFGRTQECDYACTRVATTDAYWVARADPQSPG